MLVVVIQVENSHKSNPVVQCGSIRTTDHAKHTSMTTFASLLVLLHKVSMELGHRLCDDVDFTLRRQNRCAVVERTVALAEARALQSGTVSHSKHICRLETSAAVHGTNRRNTTGTNPEVLPCTHRHNHDAGVVQQFCAVKYIRLHLQRLGSSHSLGWQ